MNITEATKKALEQGIGIQNSVCKQCNTYLLPTNTHECYLIIPMDYKLAGRNVSFPAPRWNPKADDVLNEDWELYPTE